MICDKSANCQLFKNNRYEKMKKLMGKYVYNMGNYLIN